jgi:hypothetical protein
LGGSSRDEVLGAAQHEGPDARAEPPQRCFVAVLLHRAHDDLAEAASSGVEAGRGEREQRPQLQQPVLEGRAGDGEAEVGVDRARGGIGLALVVLDLLRLVEHETAPVPGGELLALEAQHGVGGHDEVAGGRQGGDVVAAAAYDPHAETGRVGGRLLAPGGDDAGGRDDEER